MEIKNDNRVMSNFYSKAEELLIYKFIKTYSLDIDTLKYGYIVEFNKETKEYIFNFDYMHVDDCSFIDRLNGNVKNGESIFLKYVIILKNNFGKESDSSIKVNLEIYSGHGLVIEEQDLTLRVKRKLFEVDNDTVEKLSTSISDTLLYEQLEALESYAIEKAESEHLTNIKKIKDEYASLRESIEYDKFLEENDRRIELEPDDEEVIGYHNLGMYD